MTAGWEHFAEWKKINDEGEEGRVSLETMIRGVCDPESGSLTSSRTSPCSAKRKGRLRNSLPRTTSSSESTRQFQAAQQIKENQGKLGVFWHTQGSGKSYSMVFFSQKVLRKLPGNWTFLIVTDARDLDGQIYRNFASTGAVIEEETSVRAQSADHLKRLLNVRRSPIPVFTLIQKFRTEEGEKYPKLSDRDDIVVITDEAHRSQYDVFALNMRNALPERCVHRVHGHAIDRRGRTDEGSLRRLHLDLQLQAVNRRRQYRPALLREPHPRASVNERQFDRRHCGDHRRRRTR
jgi:type I restriction enzyme R subunit